MESFLQFRTACAGGQLAEAQTAWAQYRAGVSEHVERYMVGLSCDLGEVLLATCENNHLEIAQWLLSLHEPLSREAEGDNVRLLSLANLQIDGSLILRSACKNGHLAIAQWLWDLRDSNGTQLAISNVQAKDSEAFGEACGRGHQPVAKWLLSLRRPAAGAAGAA